MLHSQYGNPEVALRDGLLNVYHIYDSKAIKMPYSRSILMLKLVKVKVILYANVTRWLTF